MYELLGICLVLAALLMLNAGATVVAAACWRLLAPLTKTFSARTRADVLFSLRIVAPVMAAIVIALLLIPSYLSYEPRSTSEVVSKKLAALAIISLGSVAFAIWRTVRSWLATRALRKQWVADAEPIELPGMNISTFKIAHRFPIIAVVGSLRPRLFIADDVLRSLSEEELAAAIAHECGHLAAHDNLKRTLLRICRDSLFLVPFGRTLDRVWAETAEGAADEFAADKSPLAALNLASALVRIAKMMPVDARAEVPVGAYLVGVEQGQGVRARISRLLELASTERHHKGANPRAMKHLTLISTVGFLFIAAAVASNARVLIAVHAVIERAVSFLC